MELCPTFDEDEGDLINTFDRLSPLIRIEPKLDLNEMLFRGGASNTMLPSSTRIRALERSRKEREENNLS